MYLKRIELRGFKSFAGFTEIELAPGITGVVGPNGSGKSNIVDALRWVLGEQSSKNLRGTSMQDVIFKGTQRRPSKHSCQVSLVFDNTDGRLHSEYSEVSVMRSVSRSGDSEYRLNGTPARLRDVLDLFRDTGIGKDGYSIVGQGRVNQLLEDKASERRNVFEEAAGIMTYRVRKEESERALDKARVNTERVRDILTELNEQAGPAKEEMERANAYLDLSEELRILEIGAIVWDMDQAASREHSADEKLAELAERERAHARRVQNADSQTIEVKERHERLQALLAAATSQKAACERELEKEKGNCALQEQRLTDARDRIAKAAKSVEDKDAQRRQTQIALEAARKEADALSEQAKVEDARIDPIRSELEKLASSQETTETHEASSSEELRQRVQDELAKAKAYELEQQSVRERLESLSEDAQSAHSRAQDAQQAVLAAQEAFSEKRSNFEDLSKRLVAMQELSAEHVKRTTQLEGNLRSEQRDYAAAKAQADVLAGSLSQHEGYYESVRQLMRDAQRDPSLGQHLIGVVGDCITVKKEHETAVEIALGAGVQNVIVRSDEDAKVLVAHLRQKRYGRVTFLPSTALRISRLNNSERATLREEGVLCVASDAVECDPEVRPAVEYLLARTVIVRDLDTALRLKRENKNTFRIVTSAGDVVSQGGAITGGDAKKSQRGFLSRQREAQNAQNRALALHNQCEKTQNALAEAQENLKRTQTELSSLAAQHGRLRNEVQSAQLELQHLEERQKDAAASSDKQQSERQTLEKRLEELSSAARSSKEEADTLSQQLDAILRVEQEAAEEKTQHALQEAALKTQIAQMESEAAKTASRAQMKAAEVEHLQSAFSRLGSEIGGLDSEKAEMQRVQKEALDALEAARDRCEKAQQDGDKAKAEVERLTGEVAQLQSEADSAMNAAKELERVERELFEQKTTAKSAKERAAEVKTELNDRLWNEFTLTFGNAKAKVAKANITISRREVGKRIAQIHEKINQMGVVNPRAPEDYQNLMKRITELTTQEEDLVKAEENLKNMIAEIVKQMQDIFMEKFAQIDENFQRTFTSLFGGGTAHLELEPGVDPMLAGIDIKAEPPGKKLQSLALMSGGERAMTAIALILAMLEVNPSPVCLLDEIDAPLDDKNVERLSAYLKALSSRLQFIIITHKKTTMAASDALYGVTMPEKGVSKIVSVQLTEGENNGLVREDKGGSVQNQEGRVG